jgi:hypothetical protein
LVGDYGVNGVGDLLDLQAESAANPNGVADAGSAYNAILNAVPSIYGILNASLGGSYLCITPNAAPTLQNFGLQVFEPGGAEKATGAAYGAAELAGTFKLLVAIPASQ